jgi:hypothetical protein
MKTAMSIGTRIVLRPVTGAVLLAVGFALLLPAALPAHARKPDQSNPAYAPWFQSLTNANRHGMSCCAEADGHILLDNQSRVVGDHYQVWIAQAWQDVPPEAVLNRVDNPTGSPVVFYALYPASQDKPTIFCFVRPSDT